MDGGNGRGRPRPLAYVHGTLGSWQLVWAFAVQGVARVPDPTIVVVLTAALIDQGRPIAIAATVAGAYAIGRAIGGPLTAYAADRIGPRVLGLCGIASCAALTTWAAAGPRWSVAALVVLTVAAGLPAPPLSGAMRAVLATRVDPRRREAAFGLDVGYGGLVTIASSGLVLIGGLLTNDAAVVIAGLLVACCATAFSLLVGRRERDVPTPSGHGGRLPVALLVCTFVAVGADLGAFNAGVLAFAERHGGSHLASGPLLAWAVGGVVWHPLVARLREPGSDTLRGAVRLVALGAALAVLGLAASLPVLAVLCLLVGIAGAAAYSILLRLVGVFAGRRPTFVYSLTSTGTYVGTSAGAATAGLLMEAAGPEVAFAVAAGAALLAALIVGIGRRTLRPPDERL
jgi:MFS family permease